MQKRESFLEGFLDIDQFAAQVGRHPRTIYLWMNSPNDALPFRQLGARRLIHLETARQWLLKGVQARNPDRRRRRRTS
jgi:hypothetical protein